MPRMQERKGIKEMQLAKERERERESETRRERHILSFRSAMCIECHAPMMYSPGLSCLPHDLCSFGQRDTDEESSVRDAIARDVMSASLASPESPLCVSSLCLLSASPLCVSSLCLLSVSPLCVSSLFPLGLSSLSLLFVSFLCVCPLCVSPLCVSPLCVSPLCLLSMSPLCVSSLFLASIIESRAVDETVACSAPPPSFELVLGRVEGAEGEEGTDDGGYTSHHVARLEGECSSSPAAGHAAECARAALGSATAAVSTRSCGDPDGARHRMVLTHPGALHVSQSPEATSCTDCSLGPWELRGQRRCCHAGGRPLGARKRRLWQVEGKDNR